MRRAKVLSRRRIRLQPGMSCAVEIKQFDNTLPGYLTKLREAEVVLA